MLRRFLAGRRHAGGRRLAPRPAPAAVPLPRITRRPRWLGWMAIGVIALIISALAIASTNAPTVSAAGNPLYLHGTGTAPGCVAGTVDPTVGTRGTACQIQSAAGGITTTWGWTGLPAQTVAAGTWTFTMYWTGGTGSTNDTVSIAAGVSATASCAGFVATVPSTGTWSASYGATTTNTSSPLTVTTSASQLPLVIPPGGSLCLSVTLTHNTGGKPSLMFDGPTGTASTNFVPPSIVVPEALFGFAGLAALVPLVAGRLIRRRR